MAGQNRDESAGIKASLLEEGQRFTFVQAFRLLCSIIRKERGESPDPNEVYRSIRVRPDLALDFPESDITAIRELSGVRTRFLITATFIGLYGSSSPLPTFYTEDLFDERREDRSISRDFLDILNSPLYTLYFRIWGKYRLFFRLIEQPDPQLLERLYCLLGLGDETLQKEVRDSYGLLRYIGLFTQFPRSAEGLRSLLSDKLNERSVRIQQCMARFTEIPEDQRLILGKSGNVLGTNTYLGTEIADMMGKFRVSIGPVDEETLHRLLPDQPNFQEMQNTIRYYLDQPLTWDVEIAIDSGKIRPARLGGGKWSQLGWNTWLFKDKMPVEKISVLLPVAVN